jgi:phage virion morphogenesis protein
MQIHVNDAEVNKALADLSARLRNLKPAMREIGEIVRTSVERNFAAGGRPKWDESARVKREGGQTLSLSGRLRRSFARPGAVQAGNDRVAVGTNVVYAAIHQLGGTIVQAARSEIFVRNRYVKGPKKGSFKRGTKAGAGMTFRERRIVIPARPFLMVQNEDWTQIRGVLNRYLARGDRVEDPVFGRFEGKWPRARAFKVMPDGKKSWRDKERPSGADAGRRSSPIQAPGHRVGIGLRAPRRWKTSRPPRAMDQGILGRERRGYGPSSNGRRGRRNICKTGSIATSPPSSPWTERPGASWT